MTDYIVSVNDLTKLDFIDKTAPTKKYLQEISDWIDEIKSKQPVSLLAEGTLRSTAIGEIYVDAGKLDFLDDLFYCKYGSEPIKIYVQEVSK